MLNKLIKKYYEKRLEKVERHLGETQRKIKSNESLFEITNDYAIAGLYSYDFTGAQYHADKGEVEITLGNLNRNLNSLEEKRKNLTSKLNLINKNDN